MTSLEVVLVHGLYHQPAHMQPLVDALEDRAAVVHVPLLHRGSLPADTRVVQRCINDCADSPIVVGHSYGGAVVTGTQGAAALVFMAAFVPDLGESCASLGGPDAPVNTGVRPHPAGGTYIPAEIATELFYDDCDPVAAALAVNLLVPQASGHGRGVVNDPAWKRTASRYIICANDQAMSPELQRRMAERCADFQTISASHSPYISQPGFVAATILDTDTIR